MTRDLPYGDRVGRLHELGFPLPCYPSYRALISTLAGLTPAEHASLDWTHISVRSTANLGALVQPGANINRIASSVAPTKVTHNFTVCE